MKLLWAVSSVGKGHVMRSLTVADKLQSKADVDINWLVPEPSIEFMEQRGCTVLPLSSHLAGSGKAYEQVFAHCTDEFNLMDYIRVETKLHKQDFMVSRKAWEKTAYDGIVADEAFWLLSGFSSKWAKKPAPFIFITDFIGTRAMRRRINDNITAWKNNLGFSFSHMGPDHYIFIGSPEEIPDESLGCFLPNRRRWAQKHCCFVKPIVNFNPLKFQSKQLIRRQLKLPENGKVFLAVLGPEGKVRHRINTVEQIFACLKRDYTDAAFIMASPETPSRKWVEHHRFLDPLSHYFAASDFVITQSGYGKVAELSALGIPFIAIPLDYHFEQEFFMGQRINYYKTGRLVTFRDAVPEEIADHIHVLMNKKTRRIHVDNGNELADVILNAIGST